MRRGYDALGDTYARVRSADEDLELLGWLLDRLAPTATLLDAGFRGRRAWSVGDDLGDGRWRSFGAGLRG